MQPATLDKLVLQHAELMPDKTALLDQNGNSLAFRELADCINYLKQSLASQGIDHNHRIGIAMPQGTDLALHCLAICCHAVCVPINPGYTAAELRSLLPRLKLDYMVINTGLRMQIQPLLEQTGIKAIDCHKALIRQKPSPAAPVEQGITSPSSTALVLHTSGSTSTPKVVPLTHRHITASADRLIQSLQLDKQDRCLNMMPLFHIGGLLDLLIAPLAAGGSVICCDDMQAETFWDCNHRLAPTWYQGVPTMLEAISGYARQHKTKPGPHRLRLIRSVSSALPITLLEQLESFFRLPVIEIYGMTEACGLICSNPLPPSKRKPGSVGMVDSAHIVIMDDNGNTCPAGVSGEIAIQGRHVMQGYEDAPGAGFIGKWFCTGDSGYIDDEGYLFLTGRINELINRGGEKIAPSDIDEAALCHPGVWQAAAFALPHPSLGQEPALAVVVPPDNGAGEQQLMDFLQERLAAFKLPRHIYFLDDLPKGPSGKLQRHKLAQLVTSQPPAKSTPPAGKTPLTAALLRTWQQVLGRQSITTEDDFFDLGGDSLKATTLLNTLNQNRRQAIPAYVLYENPTVAAFEHWLREEADTGAEDQQQTANGLPVAILKSMQSFISTYGVRQDDQSLLAGANIDAPEAPLFWGVNSEQEWKAFYQAIGEQRPVYALRALYKQAQSENNTNALAMHYVDEILAIQPNGPYWIGGFCEAGKIAFAIAEQLLGMGHEVGLLCLQEQFIARDYPGDVALFFCEPTRRSPLYFHHRPEYGWKKYYHGKVSVYKTPGDHSRFYVSRHFPLFIEQLQTALKQAEQGKTTDMLASIKKRPQLQEDAYQAGLHARIFPLRTTGINGSVTVTVKNNSSCHWAASRESGIILACRWRNRRDAARSPIAGHAPLEQGLAPGESIQVELAVAAPEKPGLRFLDIDMADDGVCWFQQKGSRPCRLPALFFPGTGIITAIYRKIHRGRDEQK